MLQATLSAQLQAALKLGPNALTITRHLADEAGLNYGALEAEGGGRIWHPTKVQLNFKFEGTDAIELGNEIEQQVPYLHCFAHAHNIARSALGGSRSSWRSCTRAISAQYLTGKIVFNVDFPLLRLEMEEIYCTNAPTFAPSVCTSIQSFRCTRST